MTRISLNELVKMNNYNQECGSAEGSRSSIQRASLTCNNTGNNSNDIRKIIKKESVYYKTIE